MAQYGLGLDFGTNTVRCLVVDLADGREVATAVQEYEGGEAGVLLSDDDPHLARQRPASHIASMCAAIRDALDSAARAEPSWSPSAIAGIGVDTTGSSPMPMASDGMPLGMLPEFADNPHAQCWLWKDHTSFAEAEEITDLADAMGRPFLNKCGGAYSSEWWWSKILRCLRVAPEVLEASESWAEIQDVIPGWLTGTLGPNLKRGICAAGHKAMFHTEWGGLPDEEFLNRLDPRLGALRRRLYSETMEAGQAAGAVGSAASMATGLPEGIPVSVGAFDAHMGAVGAGIRPGALVKIMGTSTCDIMVGGADIPDIPGVCGIVPGSVVPGMMGIEAGQSAVGDLFAWCANVLDGRPDSHAQLTMEAEQLKPGESGLLALDWSNGNRTILVDAQLTGLLLGQTLRTTLGEIYRALIEATAFGSLKIIERIEESGVRVEEVICCGGIADKSPLTMQIYADVLGRPIRTSRSTQTCALGAAMFGAVAGGAYPDVLAASAKMTAFSDKGYAPNPESAAVYKRLYRLYGQLHDSFGVAGGSFDNSGVMKELLAIKREAGK